nr:LPS assembly protein LptD [Stakelama sediminis]
MLLSCALPWVLGLTGIARAQDLNPRPVQVPAPAPAPPKNAAGQDQIQFSADQLVYDSNQDIVTASGDVLLNRDGDRVRADKVVWNRKSGQVVATGNVVVTNPDGDVAYGDRTELTDTLKQGMVENLLVVLNEGGRIAAQKGELEKSGAIHVEHAAYTACSVTNSDGCPKEPSWKITAAKVVYDPNTHRIHYSGARLDLFNVLSIPLPAFSHPVGDTSDSGFLTPNIRYDRVNGVEAAVPYFISIAPNRDLTVTPHIFTAALPMLQLDYRELNRLGAFDVTAYGTYSSKSDDLLVTPTPANSVNAFRGYIEANGRYQLSPEWSASAALRVTTDKTFLRRYDISSDTRLRNNIGVERIDRNNYFSIEGWAVQTLRLDENGALQPFALPEIDYRRRIANTPIGGTLNIQLNSLALSRTEGQDTQRAFASAEWDWRGITRWGQEVQLTAYARGDIYHSSNNDTTSVAAYRGDPGFQGRAIAALALDVKWPLVGQFLGGTQRLTPRIQVVASPPIRNMEIPNEDSRAVDLEDSNLFALNRFPGYDRFEDSTRFTYGVDWDVNLPEFSLSATVGQSYRLTSEPSLFPEGTGLTDRLSDIVGRTEIRYKDFVSLVHRYRLDKDNFAIRRNEIDATIGSRKTYALVGYLNLNRNITPTLEDLRDREELRTAGRVAFGRFWSAFGSIIIDLTNRDQDPLSLSNGFSPIRHRLGIAYEDDCLKLGLTWKRDYEDTGDAKRGNSFLLTLSFKNLGR